MSENEYWFIEDLTASLLVVYEKVGDSVGAWVADSRTNWELDPRVLALGSTKLDDTPTKTAMGLLERKLSEPDIHYYHSSPHIAFYDLNGTTYSVHERAGDKVGTHIRDTETSPVINGRIHVGSELYDSIASGWDRDGILARTSLPRYDRSGFGEHQILGVAGSFPGRTFIHVHYDEGALTKRFPELAELFLKPKPGTK